MGIFWKFDAWLLAKCQAFSDWLTKTIGLQEANYKIANVCAGLAMIGWLAAGIVFGGPFEFLNYMTVFIGLGSGAWTFVVYFAELAADNTGKVRKNPHFWESVRCIQLLISLGQFVVFFLAVSSAMIEGLLAVWHNSLCLLAGVVFTTCFIYFVSCSSLPPTTSKVAQWLMKSFMKLVPVNAKR